MSKSRYHHVRRIDVGTSRIHCWRVQIQCNLRIVTRQFSDGIYGGKRKALRAALIWRDAMLNVIQQERKKRWLRNITVLRRNNSSGMVGVGRYVSRELVGKCDVERVSWHAFWQGTDGKRHCRKFAVKKYGERRAKALACAERKSAIAELIAIRHSET